MTQLHLGWILNIVNILNTQKKEQVRRMVTQAVLVTPCAQSDQRAAWHAVRHS